MRAVLWEIIQKNWIPLLNDVGPHADHISVILYQREVLTPDDKENVTKKKTSQKKITTLLNILRNKPEHVNAFDELLAAIERDKGLGHIVEALKNTPVTSSIEFVTKGDPRELEQPVRKVLLRKYANRPGKTKLSDILQTLQQNVKCPGGFNWKNEQLSKFISEVFANVSVKPELNPASGKKIIYIVNLIPIETVEINNENTNNTPAPLAAQKPVKDNVKESTTNKAEAKHVEAPDLSKVVHYNSKELRLYLKCFFEERQISTDLPTEFEEQQIIGEVFLSLTERKIKEICPLAELGVVLSLTMLIKKLNSQVLSTPPILADSVVPEKLRDFNCEACEGDSYIQGRFIDVKRSQTSKKLVPVHYFCLLQEVDFQSDEHLAYEMLSSRAIQFISGCCNNHQNGTIYFGIDPGSGLIEGLALEKDKVIGYINRYTEKAFPEEHFKNPVKNVMRSPVCIPVLDAGFEKTEKFVVEVDVVASSACIQNIKLKTRLKDLKYLPASAKKSRKTGYFSLDENGEPLIMGHDKLEEFFHQVEVASQLRKAEEEMVCAPSPENLRQKLLNLLTGGREKLEDVIYPFILLSTIDTMMDKNFLTRNMQFIKHLDTDVVFDFDATGSMKGIYHCYDILQGELMTVLTLDNFVSSVNSKFIDSIDTDKLSWVFCNGYEPSSIKPRSPMEWNKQIRSAFQKALKHFEKNRCKDRVIVIICLFSKDYETMLEGCEEILTSFPNQWVVYAESESIAEMWKKEMIQRKKVDQKDALQRFVVGMTWEQINDTIAQATHHADTKGCILPQAAGTFTKPIPEKKLKSWCDIELLSSADPDISEDLSQKVMESFYKGESVDWLNFWFEGQVLKRSHHTCLLELVEKALTEEEENKVSTVILFHHPGSGATTSAKHVLWELRKKYRCCVIKKITEDTIDQLIEIRHFSEPSQSLKPVLILVDNEDEEKYRQLKQNLEMKCKNFHRENADAYKVFFTMLFCIRKATLPQQALLNQMLLEQKLTKQEKKLFGKKKQQLTSDFENNKENIDPKFLISFNILKKDFNPDYINKSVKEFIRGVKDEREQTLLSYIALLNKYDPQFRSIPVSCFDSLFNKKLEISFKRKTNWEANLSQAVQVLLSISQQKKSGTTDARISLRVLHRLVADSLLQNLITSKNSLNDTMLKLISSVVFDQDTEDFVFLKNIVGDIMKKREFNQEDGKKEMFSPFITQVNKDCGEEVSIKLLCDFFDRTHDPFIAQQIARFYYCLKNWDKAEKYAENATDLKPNSSFLWDTFGQVYKAQLKDESDKAKKILDITKKNDNNFVRKIIGLAQKAISYFKKAQELNENNPSDMNENNAGYFGELKTQIILLRLLEKCQCFKSHIHLMNCLVNKDFSEDCFKFLMQDEKCFLIELEDNCMNTLRVLDEQYLQVREDALFDVTVYLGTLGRDLEIFISLMFSFHDYFGAPENYDYIKKLPEPEASMHRWRIALKFGAKSLNLLLRLRAQSLENTKEKNHYAQNLITIYNLLLPNVSSENCEYNYLLGMLNAVTLIVVDKLVSKCKTLSYSQVLDLSKKLLESKQPNEKRPFVEPYMYFVMFNFPSETRNNFSICTLAKLQEACDKWRKAYDQKFKGGEARTFFYLAKGELLNDLVHSDTFPMKGRDNWDDPEMRTYLALYAGTVEIGGKRVNVKITKDDNTLYLNIPTSYTVKKNFWQRETYFFIGFSFSGPKAYGIPQAPPETCDDLAHDDDFMAQDIPMSSKYLMQEKNPPKSRTRIREIIILKTKLNRRRISTEHDELQDAWEDQIDNALID